MDYKAMILRGIIDVNNREYLSDYIFREYKIASEKYYTAEAFFSGCYRVLDNFGLYFSNKLIQREKELNLLLLHAEVAGNEKSKENLILELNGLNQDDFEMTVNVDNRYFSLKLEGVKHIKKAIIEAELKLSREIQALKYAGQGEKLNEPSVQQQIEEILKPFFINSGEPQFKSLIDYITFEKKPGYVSPLQRNGTKLKLYKALNEIKVRKLASRKWLLEVFTDEGLNLDIEYSTLDHKI